jgi:hypothetical protein
MPADNRSEPQPKRTTRTARSGAKSARLSAHAKAVAAMMERDEHGRMLRKKPLPTAGDADPAEAAGTAAAAGGAAPAALPFRKFSGRFLSRHQRSSASKMPQNQPQK